MQNPPVSAATPTIPSGQEVGAVVEMVWCLPIPSRRTGEPLPIFNSVTLKVPCVLPMGVVSSTPTSSVKRWTAASAGDGSATQADIVKTAANEIFKLGHIQAPLPLPQPDGATFLSRKNTKGEAPIPGTSPLLKHNYHTPLLSKDALSSLLRSPASSPVAASAACA